jgi:hypothetical protein
VALFTYTKKLSDRHVGLALCVGLLASLAADSSAQSQDSLAQSGGLASSANHFIAQDVTRSYGDYRYLPQKGLYKDTTIRDAIEDVGSGISDAGSFINGINRYTSWTQYGSSGDFSWSIPAGIVGIGLPSVGATWGSPYVESNSGYLSFRAGPLLLDNFYAGIGAIYSDINGELPGRDQFPPDDRWMQMVWLSFRTSFAIGDSIGVSIQPFMYWLPATGKVGWGLPGPLGGMMAPQQLGAMSLFQIAWNKQVGNWNLTAYDVFNPLLMPYNIWDSFLTANAAWGDLSPVERAGRYSLGYGAGDLTNYDPQGRFGVGGGDYDPLRGFYNVAGVRATGRHGYQTQSLFYFDRFDLWDKDFRDVMNTVAGGAYIRTGDASFNTYAGYNFVSAEPFNTFLNWAVIGARKQVSHSLGVYAQGGYYWMSGAGKGDQGVLGLAGFQQRLGERTYHLLEAGRRVYRPVSTAPGIEDFVDYRIIHHLGARTTIQAVAGMSERRAQTTIENDYDVKYGGVFINSRVGTRTTVFASSGWERLEMESDNFIWQRWTHRLGLMYTLTQDIQSQCFYQYEDVHGPYNYTEHFLYLGVSKRF